MIKLEYKIAEITYMEHSGCLKRSVEPDCSNCASDDGYRSEYVDNCTFAIFPLVIKYIWESYDYEFLGDRVE